MNPHSTYANLSDEEQAGLDARGQQTAYDRGYMAGFIAAQRVTAEAVQALESPFDDARLSAAYYAAIADVAALLEDNAEPSHSEIGGPDGHGNVILERLGKP